MAECYHQLQFDINRMKTWSFFWTA